MPNVVEIVVRSIDRTSEGFDKASAGFAKAAGGMMNLAATVGPGISGPIVAAAGASVAAVASIGGALGAFGAAAIPQFTKVTEVTELYTAATKAAEDGSADAAKKMEEYNKALAKLPPATRDTAKEFMGLKGDFEKWSDSLSSSTMPVFTEGLKAMRGALPALTPLVKTASSALLDFVGSIRKGVESGGFARFMDQLNGAAKKTLPDFLNSLKNLGAGFAGILSAFLPFSGNMTGALERLTRKFREFGEGLSSNTAFQDFMARVSDSAPGIIEMLGNLGQTFLAIGQALAPFSGVGLAVAQALAKILGAIPQGAMDFIAPTIAAIVLATKAWAIAQGILNIAMAANPVGAVVIAIVALVAVLVVAWQKSQTFREIVTAGFTGIGIGALQMVKVVVMGLKFMLSAYLTFVSSMVDLAAKAFGWVPGLGGKLKSAADAIRGFRDSATKFFDGAIDKINEWQSGLLNMNVVVRLKGDIKDLQNKIDKAKKEMESVPPEKRAKLLANIDDWNRKMIAATVALERTPDRKKAILTSTITDWTNKLNAAKNQLKSVPTSKRAALLATISDLQSKVRAARAALASVQSKSVTITAYYRKVNAGQAPAYNGYAHGGITGAAQGGLQNGMTWVGENGPELADLPPGTNILSAGQSRAMVERSNNSAGNGMLSIQLTIGNNTLGEIMIDPLRKAVWTRGGDVQAVLGRR